MSDVEVLECNAMGVGHPAHVWDFGSGQQFFCSGDSAGWVEAVKGLAQVWDNGPNDVRRRPDVLALLTEGADTQHTVALTWQEARDLLARLDRDAADVETRVREAIDCPHGPRHYYAIDAVCQRCGLPSWVEALLRAALSGPADEHPADGTGA